MYEMAAQGIDPRDFGSRVNTAYTARQNQQQQGGQQGGVDAAGRPVQVITPNTPVNVLPAPLTVPTVGQEIGNEEQTPTGDMADHDGEYQTFGQEPAEDGEQSEMSRLAMLDAMARAGRKNMQQQTKDNTQQTRIDEF